MDNNNLIYTGSSDQQLELEHTPPAVPCSRLTCIAAPLMKSLTLLLHSVEQEQDDIKRLRKELAHYKELATTAGGFLVLSYRLTFQFFFL